MDTMGYNIESRPGRPAGGEALGLLTLDAMLKGRYSGATTAESESESNSDTTQPLPESKSGKSTKKSTKKSSTAKKRSTKKTGARATKKPSHS